MALHFSTSAHEWVCPDFSLEERASRKKRVPLSTVAANVDLGRFFPPDEEKKASVRFVEPFRQIMQTPSQQDEAFNWATVVDEAMDQSSPSVRVDLR